MAMAVPTALTGRGHGATPFRWRGGEQGASFLGGGWRLTDSNAAGADDREWQVPGIPIQQFSSCHIRRRLHHFDL